MRRFWNNLSPRKLSPALEGCSPRGNIPPISREKPSCKRSLFTEHTLQVPEIRLPQFTGPSSSLLRSAEKSKRISINTPDRRSLLDNGVSDKYNIVSSGGFGTIYNALYHDNDVILKLIRLGSDGKKSIENERLALNLDHKNIIKMLNVFCSASAHYGLVVMEKDSQSLDLASMLVDQDVLWPLVKQLSFALDIARGVQHCHQKNLLHLDLKPRNVLVVNSDYCKLCDFGSCQAISTVSAPVCGQTVAYAAPELWKGHRPTVKCDIYSMGIIFWELAHRSTPYARTEPYSLIYQICKHEKRPTISPISHEQFALIYSNCWRTNPEDRQSTSTLLMNLVLYLNQNCSDLNCH